MAAVADSLNPYIAGSPVTDAKMFFGREDIFDWIRHSLAGQFADHILVIHGQRRVGKTSVLKQLPHRLPERYIPVFFDLQGRTRTSLDRFLWWLAREIVRVLKQDREVVLPLPEKEAFAQDLEYLESQFLPELRRLLPDHTLLLTFDEFDTLEEEEARKTLGQPLTETLRRLMGREGLNFIFSIGSSGRKLENMQASYTEFFKAALYKKVSFLGRQEAHDLITRPVKGVLEYQAEAVRAIYETTSGHPYFTQLVCHELFALCQKTGQRTVAPTDVSGVLDEVIERGTVNLKFVWDEASELEKWVLASLAQCEAGMPIRALGESLRRQRVRFDDPDLNSSLIRLREKDVLTPENDFVIFLMRLWLQRNRSLDQVREELVERSPIASRYLEIGLEYLDTGLVEKALESFRQVLEIDPQNLGAQVRIAEVHLRQGRHAEAAAQFEKALSIDDEDVAARAGLCAARLTLGDQALARGRAKEAMAAFRQVLTVNPEHAEARQRMADLARGAAEKALDEGRDEEALASFEEAIGYTPEDQGLEARYLRVREEKKAQILAALPAKARSLAAAERWEEAFAAWQDYLRLEPPDPERAQAEIERLKEAQAQAGTYDQAQAALARRDYNQAISILKGIVARDETYKDSTRLLLQAIEGRRRARPRWKWKWKRIHISRRVWLGLAAGTGALALGAAVLANWEAITRQFSQEPEPTPASVVSPPGATSTAIVPAASAPALSPVWEPLSSDRFLPRDTITAIAVDPGDSHLIYVATANAGVYRSRDAGQSWLPAFRPNGRADISAFLIDASDPTTFFAADQSGWVYRSTDAGETWRLILEESASGVIAVDPRNSAHIYSVGRDGLLETLNEGASWNPVVGASELPAIRRLAVDPLSSSTLFALGALQDTWAVLTSTDGGRSWAAADMPEGIRPDWIGAGTSGVLGNDGRRAFLNPGGSAWTVLADLPFDNDWVIAVSPHDPKTLVLGGEGIWISNDGGASWIESSDGLPASQLDLYASPAARPELFLETSSTYEEQCRVFHSADEGISWEALPAPGCGLALDAEGEVLYQDRYRSLDRGQTWEELSMPGQGRYPTAHPSTPGLAYMAMHDNPLARTEDYGAHWEILASLGNDVETHLYFAEDGRMYAIAPWGGERSDTDGSTWEPCARFQLGAMREPVDGSSTVTQLIIDPQDGDRLLVATRGLGVLRSPDGCRSWQASSHGLTSLLVNSLVKSPQSDQTVFAGTDAGVFVSHDGGGNWQAAREGLPGTLIIYSLLAQPDGGIIAATPHGLYRGLFRLVGLTGTAAAESLAEFAEPILEAVSERSPLFEYDFSTSSPPGSSFFGDPNLAGGELRCQVDQGECGFSWDAGTSEFVAEYEFTFMTATEGAYVGFHFRQAENDLHEFWVTLLPDSADAEWALVEQSPQIGPSGVDVLRARTVEVAVGLRTKVTVLALGRRVGVLLNGEPLAYYEDSPLSGGWYELRLSAAEGIGEVYFDNVRFWDLTGYAAPPPTAMAATPPPTATAMPGWVTDFAQPILDAIATRPPNFQDDFDDRSGLWKGRYWDVSLEYRDGEMVLDCCAVYRENIDYPDVVIEFDARFLPETTTEGAYWGLLFRQTEGSQNYELRTWYDGRVELLGFGAGDLSFRAANPDCQSNRYLLIAKGSQFGFFVNGQPLTHLEDYTNKWGTIVFALPSGPEYALGKPVMIALDNFKLWDISDLSTP